MESVEVLAARLRANPEDQQAYLALKAAYRRLGDLGSLANLIAGWAGWVGDDRAAGEAYVEVAGILHQEMSDLEQAEAFYREALRRDPLSSAASDGLQALFEAREDDGALLELLNEQLRTLPGHGGTPKQLAVLRFRLGELWGKRSGEPVEALKQYKKAIELDPGLVAALYEARQLYLAQGDLRTATELYDREAAAEPDPERKIALLLELSALYRDELDDLDGAVSALQRALHSSPADVTLSYELASLLIKRAEQADERTAEVDRARAADLLFAVARTLDPEQARAYLESALDCTPGHDQSLSELERLLGNDTQTLARHWVSYIAAAPDGRNASRRRLKLAQAYADNEQVEDAIYCLQPAAQAGFPPAVELMQTLRRRQGGAQPASAPAPSSGPPSARGPSSRSPAPAPVPAHPTVDFDDVGTQVGEVAVINSLREASIEQPPASDRPGRARPDRERTTAPPPMRGERKKEPIRVPAQEPTDILDELDALDSLDDEKAPPAPAPPSFAQAPALTPAPAPPPSFAQAASPAPVGELSDLRRTAAELARAQRNDEATAVYEEVLRLDPLDREAFAYLDGYYRRRQEHGLRAELLERGALATELPLNVRVSRLREAASTYETRLKDYGAAIRCVRALLELEPESDDLQRGLRRLLERGQRWDDLARLTEEELARTPNAEQKLPILKRLLALHREKRADRAATADVLERILELRPDDRSTRDALIEELLSLGRYDEAAQLLERKAEEAPAKSQKLPLLRSVASLYHDKLKDLDRAFGVYERILALVPDDVDALAQMTRMDEGAGNFERLLSTLERQTRSSTGAQAAAIFARMATIADGQLHDVDRASELLSRAVDLAPDNPQHLRTLCQLYEREDRYEDLVELLRERVVLEKNAHARAELHRHLAVILGERLNDTEGAREAWEQLLQIKEDRDALLALQQRALERDDPEKLVELLGRLAAIETVALERRDLLFERSRLLASRLGRPAQAIPDLARILVELDPDFEPALDELWRSSDAASDHRALASVLERMLERAQEPEARIEHARTLADLYEQRLPDAERAIRVLARWTETDPGDVVPRRRLVPLLARSRRHQELLLTLDALGQLEPEDEARARALIEAAEVAFIKLKDVDGAWGRLAPLVLKRHAAAVEAVVALAENARRLDALYDLLEQAGEVERLLALLRQRVTRERDAATRARLLRRTAQILVEYAQDEDGASAAYEKLLELEEDADALRFLQSRALRRDDPKTLADVLRRLAALERDPQERCDLLLEHARLLTTRLGEAQAAVSVLKSLSAEHPDSDAVLDGLMRAAEAAKDPQTLAATLERLLNRTQTVEGRIELSSRLADVCELELKDPVRGIGALHAWSQADPTDVVPHRRLRPLLQHAGRGRELLATLDALGGLESDRDARIEATVAAAELARGRLADQEGAWQRLLPLVPEADARVDQALHALATQMRRLDGVYDALEAAGRHDALVEWLRERVRGERDAAAKVALYRRIARTLAGPLDDGEAAAEAFSKLLELGEDAEALQFLRSRALRRDDMETVCDCLERLAKLEQDKGEQRDLLYERGHLLRTRLGRPKDAVAVLRDVVERLDPDFEPALDELVEASEAVGDERTLALALDRLCAREADPERRVELTRRLCDLYERLGDSERLRATLHAFSEHDPENPEPHRRLIALLRGVKRYGELVTELDRLAAKTSVPEERIAASVEAATLAFERQKDPASAFERLVPLANQGHQEAEALLVRIAFESGREEELAALYEQAERYDDLVTVLRERAERTKDKATRGAIYRRCARLLAGPLGDEVAAVEAYREVLAAGEDLEALTFLREVAQRLDDPEELAGIVGRLASLTDDPVERRDLLFERALLLGDRLDQPEQASDVLRIIVSTIDPSFLPAIEELIALAEARDDYASLALALERQLALAGSAGARAEIAERLATLYEDKLTDSAKATAALLAWTQADPEHLEPLRRLRPHLEAAKRFGELLPVLDTLSQLEESPAAVEECTLAAAALASGPLGDATGAWARLEPLLLSRSESAERAASALVAKANLQRPLANLYVLRAQHAQTVGDAVSDWMAAARIYEQALDEPLEALEASLRALALDMSNPDVLGEIDRLGVLTSAWERLARVYTRLVQQAPAADARVVLLLRHADLLERQAKDPAAALERVMEACRLAPAREDLLLRALALAEASGNPSDLVAIYEKLASGARSDERRAGYLLCAAKVADLGLQDREHAMRNLTQALELAETLPQVAADIEDLARELDEARPELGRGDARRSLIRAHMELAPRVGEPFGPVLVLRASQLWRDELGDDSACFDVLKQGATLFPNDLDLYDALERAALAIKRLDALDAHLARCVSLATDRDVKRALLQRRSKLLGEHLGRHAKAADVCRELLALEPGDSDAFDTLLRYLREAGRFRELVKAYEERLGATHDPRVRVALLRAMAALWEVELKNRPSARELWQQIKAIEPSDEEATAALSRLSL